jgi:hypothetical protein
MTGVVETLGVAAAETAALRCLRLTSSQIEKISKICVNLRKSASSAVKKVLKTAFVF